MNNVLLVKYSEIALRGKNRYLFEGKLISSIRRVCGDDDVFSVSKEQGRILVECTDESLLFDVMYGLANILGVAGVCPSIMTSDQNIDNICALALLHMKRFHSSGSLSFKVVTRRASKKYPLPSNTVSSLVGAFVLDGMDNLSVDVHNPDVTLMVELRNNCYIYSKVIPGFGGLPVGSTGKAILLLSGGIDSPVAGFLSAKRGVELECVYFHAPPYVSIQAKQKVLDLAERLAVFTGDLTLHIVPFTDIQLYLRDNVHPEKLTIFLKRLMLRIADRLALDRGAHGLITGDSLGQVASQTLASICAVTSASSLPVIRPLSGFNKQEIVDLAARIGTYDISIRPFEDCCTLFTARHPETRPLSSVIERIESNLVALDDLINSAFLNIESVSFKG